MCPLDRTEIKAINIVNLPQRTHTIIVKPKADPSSNANREDLKNNLM